MKSTIAVISAFHSGAPAPQPGYRPFFPSYNFTCISRKSTGVSNNRNDGSVPLSVPMSYTSDPAHIIPGPDPEWSADIINVNIKYTCASPAPACQTVWGKGLTVKRNEAIKDAIQSPTLWGRRKKKQKKQIYEGQTN